ncbi:acyl-homoserine-lactone synthase [Sphingomonas sp.]|jgi:N-acyl-L-homoserine lactone synthetase|uniref:acyl-homoserine-lactone synthase n=1 Tax=Sphingomonas sp. TaxID=28214 RepID=UPI002DEE258C|nr:acyl-homoserine-lactone synthase [Sphingomonas sp.]HEV2567905.1 acyl-homoserine-lactone synthase [Sphingomonas sp.]
MLAVLDRFDRHPSDHSLARSMHRDRKRIFIDRMGWDLPHAGHEERDAYDGPAATYMVVTGREEGQHMGSLRLLPTTGPHLLGDVFSHLCSGGIPRGPEIMEITRLCVSPDCPKDQSLAVRRRLVGALVEYALLTGVRAYTMLTEVSLLSRVAALGWRCEMLGMPAAQGKDMIAALMVHVDPNTIPLLRRAGVYQERSIDRMELRPSAGHLMEAA